MNIQFEQQVPVVEPSEALTLTESLSLLDQYQPHNHVYFSNQYCETLAKPPFASLLRMGIKDISQQVKESLKFASGLGFEQPMVIGATPFDVDAPGSLRVATCVQQTEKSDYRAQGLGGNRCVIDAFPCADIFRRSVSQALSRFEGTDLDKVVLSRTLKVQAEKSFDIQALVKNLSAKNQLGYTIAVNLPDEKKGFDTPSSRVLLGASPELLVSRKGNRIYANPLAGSELRQQDPERDRQISQALLQSEKDLREHAFVVKEIRSALSLLCRNIVTI